MNRCPHKITQSLISKIDLKPVKVQLSKKFPRRSKKNIKDQIHLYQIYLYLILKYPDVCLVPPAIVDEVWHEHILMTKKYSQDCQKVFKKFIHHNPGGTTKKLIKGHQQTLLLVQKEFPKWL